MLHFAHLHKIARMHTITSRCTCTVRVCCSSPQLLAAVQRVLLDASEHVQENSHWNFNALARDPLPRASAHRQDAAIMPRDNMPAKMDFYRITGVPVDSDLECTNTSADMTCVLFCTTIATLF